MSHASFSGRLYIGQVVTYTRTITDADIRRFAELSGDTNPLHLDDAYAQRTRFGARIAHAAYISSFFSQIVGTQMPGPGTIFVNQRLRFRSPVYIGETVTASVEITALGEAVASVHVRLLCTVEGGRSVIEGEASLLFEPVTYEPAEDIDRGTPALLERVHEYE
jgi:acyl dehydratase